MAQDASEVDEIERETGTSACAKHKRKRIFNADDLEKPLGAGPTVREDTEEVTGEPEERDAPIDLRCMERDAPMAQEPGRNESTRTAEVLSVLAVPSSEPHINTSSMELQNFYREMNEQEIDHITRKLKLFEAEEVEIDKVRMNFKKKNEEEKIRFEQRKLVVKERYHKVLPEKYPAMSKHFSEDCLTSGSCSSQGQEKGTTSSPASSSKEIPGPIPLNWDIIPTPSPTNSVLMRVPVVPPGFDVPPGLDLQRPTLTKGFRKKARPNTKPLNEYLLSLRHSSGDEIDHRERVEAILMAYDALRRRLEQKPGRRQPDKTAGAIMNAKDLIANEKKQVGSVPGIEVGDIFYYRMEMFLVGLHSRPMDGIDHMLCNDYSIAISIVASNTKRYKNEADNVGEIVYDSQKRMIQQPETTEDQKLKGGNYAMNQSRTCQNSIRVIRSSTDPLFADCPVYIYDGLYKIDATSVEMVGKYKLVKEEGQHDGFAVWKNTNAWKMKRSSRGTVLIEDLSSKKETIPVVVFNDVDNKPAPNNFQYIIRFVPEQTLESKTMVLAGCKCKKSCPGGTDCSCIFENGGRLPYGSSGLLTKWLPLLYECGPGCECSRKCPNRVTQQGVRHHFEVFRTQNRGWGLRSWDPIRSGSFVCEFLGEYLENLGPESNELVLNDYVFCTTNPPKKTLNWNQCIELDTEGSENTTDETHPQPEPILVPVVINAKDMGNVSRFINHSCNPNLFWQLVQHGHGTDCHTHVMFFALKPIPPMTELTYDRNTTEESNRGASV